MTGTDSPLRFHLPEQGVFKPNGPDDPLPYNYKPLVGSVYRARIEQALSLLAPPFGSILELGYGSGVLLPSLCRLGGSVSGIDLQSEPEQVNRALEQVGVQCRLVRGDVGEDYFSGESFDLIVAISIFEHIRDLAPVFERMHSLLRPDGQLLVGMPRVDRLMARGFSLIGFSGIDEHHVTDYITCKQVAAAGFELIASAHIPTMLPEFCGLYFNMLFQKREDR
jgi:2-polyprenyl-3-methyl-5-hydroxy-6-metoxy-1,4-benzoquinol methylase